MERKTGFSWCVAEKIRPLELSQWPTDWVSFEQSFFTEVIEYIDFLERIRQCRVKPNSLPRKTEEYLEYRMYGLVMYNLSDIQKGIQFGHAKDEYGIKYGHTKSYQKWLNIDKTYYIMNGGTSNRHGYSEYDVNPTGNSFGSMEKYGDELTANGILFTPFYEPDLNNATSGIAFLVDERAFDTVLHPDFVRSEFMDDEQNEKQYQNWVEKIGGPKNVYLRELLPKLRFA